MNVIKRRICAALILLMILTLCPAQALAAGPIDTDRRVTLHISFMDEGTPISRTDFSLYKVASVNAYGELTLTSEFEAYKDKVTGLSQLESMTQDTWMDLASTLRRYAHKFTPVAKGRTDREGSLTFPGLEVGLYFVVGDSASVEGWLYSSKFMLFLPGGDEVNNDWIYDLTVSPKFEKRPEGGGGYDPESEYVSRKVVKIWDDEGYESIRPAKVTVQLLRDGEVYDTETLSEKNNWRCSWDKLDPDHDWEVVEKPVEGYTVSITGKDTVVMTNSYWAPDTEADPAVQKRVIGDTPETDGAFTFVFKAEDGSCPMPAGSRNGSKEITINGAGSMNVGEITFTEPGTYVYTVSEKNTGEEGYTYDSAVYTLTYKVSETDDGALEIRRTIQDSKGNTASAIVFTNTFNKTPIDKLPQTGAPWWPVIALLFAGFACLTVGAYCRRSCGR